MENLLQTIKKLFSQVTPSTTQPKSDVVVRIAPSPTGTLHVGTARAALANYLFAKKNNGKFLLRIEDTDKSRSTKAFEDNIVAGLRWLGIIWDNETLYRQSERTAIYKLHLEKMIADGTAFISKEEVKKEGSRSEVIRFKNPNKIVTFEDEIRGEITFDTTELGDFVIAKSTEEPLYHLTVVVDDFEMRVTHVIRGEDHISNTPRQILIQEAIGAKRPLYAHLPLLLGPDKSKLSKRHGAKSVLEYKDSGYLPEAMINYLALLGWNPGTDEERFTLAELCAIYDLEKAQKGGAVFTQEKLDWFNQYYIQQLSAEERIEKLTNEFTTLEIPISPERIAKIEPVISERIVTLNDVAKMHEAGEFTYYYEKPAYDFEKIHWKKAENNHEAAIHLAQVQEKISTSEDGIFDSVDTIKSIIWDYADNNGKGNVLWPLRYSLCGKEKSPDPFTLLYILGKEESLSRISNALVFLKEHESEK
jgi:glutamyl-tRNA synthetase